MTRLIINKRKLRNIELSFDKLKSREAFNAKIEVVIKIL